MLIGNIRKNGLNHFIVKEERTMANTGEKFTSYQTMCNTLVIDWYKGDKEPLNFREWRGQKICVSCALQAYKMDLIDLIPTPGN